MVATEKVAISHLRPDFGCHPPHMFDAMDIPGSKSLIAPHGVFCVKGWTRTYCLSVILLATYECEELLKARSSFGGALVFRTLSLGGFHTDC